MKSVRNLALPVALVFAMGAIAVAQNAAPSTTAKKPATAAKSPAAKSTKPAVVVEHAAPPSANEQKSVLGDSSKRLSYALGMDLGNQLKGLHLDIDSDSFAKGLKASMSGQGAMMTPEEVRQAISDMQAEMKKREAEARRRGLQDGTTASRSFLAQNKEKKDVVTLPDGLQYKILRAGQGDKATVEDAVLCNYTGRLIDGTEFDSSFKHGGPATLPVNSLIKGMTEALQLMPVGSHWELYIPAELAYGDRGIPGTIGPNNALIFDLEVVSIKKDAAKPAQQPVQTPAPSTQAPQPQTSQSPSNN